MLIIISQIILLFVAVALPLRHKKLRFRKIRPISPKDFRIDTDTTHANYAINEFGSLEKISRVNQANQRPEMEN